MANTNKLYLSVNKKNDLIMCIAQARMRSKFQQTLCWNELTGTRNKEHRGSILDSVTLL